MSIQYRDNYNIHITNDFVNDMAKTFRCQIMPTLYWSTFWGVFIKRSSDVGFFYEMDVLWKYLSLNEGGLEIIA